MLNRLFLVLVILVYSIICSVNPIIEYHPDDILLNMVICLFSVSLYSFIIVLGTALITAILSGAFGIVLWILTGVYEGDIIIERVLDLISSIEEKLV